MLSFLNYQIICLTDLHGHTRTHTHIWPSAHLQLWYGELSIDSTCWCNWCLWGRGWDVCDCMCVCVCMRGTPDWTDQDSPEPREVFSAVEGRGAWAWQGTANPPSLTHHVPGRTGWPPGLALLTSAYRRVSRQEEPFALWESQQPGKARLVS